MLKIADLAIQRKIFPTLEILSLNEKDPFRTGDENKRKKILI